MGIAPSSSSSPQLKMSAKLNVSASPETQITGNTPASIKSLDETTVKDPLLDLPPNTEAAKQPQDAFRFAEAAAIPDAGPTTIETQEADNPPGPGACSWFWGSNDSRTVFCARGDEQRKTFQC